MIGKISIDEMTKKLEKIFPQIRGRYRILKLEDSSSEVQLLAAEENLRPGNTISGPTMFELADISFYVAVLALTGYGTLAVTTNVSINFLRKPFLNDLIAVAKIKKSGRQLVVGDVEIFSEDRSAIFAHAIFTYSVPPS
tara:strand:- start:169 stop:585 length:417 start_codon:yes stop_codon:yes gene_type:complete